MIDEKELIKWLEEKKSEMRALHLAEKNSLGIDSLATLAAYKSYMITCSKVESMKEKHD